MDSLLSLKRCLCIYLSRRVLSRLKALLYTYSHRSTFSQRLNLYMCWRHVQCAKFATSSLLMLLTLPELADIHWQIYRTCQPAVLCVHFCKFSQAWHCRTFGVQAVIIPRHDVPLLPRKAAIHTRGCREETRSQSWVRWHDEVLSIDNSLCCLLLLVIIMGVTVTCMMTCCCWSRDGFESFYQDQPCATWLVVANHHDSLHVDWLLLVLTCWRGLVSSNTMLHDLLLLVIMIACVITAVAHSDSMLWGSTLCCIPCCCWSSWRLACWLAVDGFDMLVWQIVSNNNMLHDLLLQVIMKACMMTAVAHSDLMLWAFVRINTVLHSLLLLVIMTACMLTGCCWIWHVAVNVCQDQEHAAWLVAASHCDSSHDDVRCWYWNVIVSIWQDREVLPANHFEILCNWWGFGVDWGSIQAQRQWPVITAWARRYLLSAAGQIVKWIVGELCERSAVVLPSHLLLLQTHYTESCIAKSISSNKHCFILWSVSAHNCHVTNTCSCEGILTYYTWWSMAFYSKCWRQMCIPGRVVSTAWCSQSLCRALQWLSVLLRLSSRKSAATLRLHLYFTSACECVSPLKAAGLLGAAAS